MKARSPEKAGVGGSTGSPARASCAGVRVPFLATINSNHLGRNGIFSNTRINTRNTRSAVKKSSTNTAAVLEDLLSSGNSRAGE
jgi:hypothetical protein